MTDDAPAPWPADPVLRDDRLLDALSRGDPPPADHPTDDPLVGLLADWHTNVVARAAGDPPDPSPLPRPASPPPP
ncbi:MAG TPA: anti-sigma-D factor RsdA, partial [Micromonospora sp.]